MAERVARMSGAICGITANENPRMSLRSSGPRLRQPVRLDDTNDLQVNDGDVAGLHPKPHVVAKGDIVRPLEKIEVFFACHSF
jgi:hypothetical protein